MTVREVKNDDARFWHLTDKPPAPEFVVYWTNNGQKAALGLDLSAAIDPSRTSRCSRGLDYRQSTLPVGLSFRST